MRGIQDRPGLEPRACLKIEGKAHDLSGQAGKSDVPLFPALRTAGCIVTRMADRQAA
jgi:hypothetical protein